MRLRRVRIKPPSCLFSFFSLFLLSAAVFGAAWPQWGGRNARNMVSEEKGLPATFDPGKKETDGSGIDPATTRNVKWTRRIGSACYGNPTIAHGRIFIGTDDILLSRDPRFRRTRGGLVQCLDEETGGLLWKFIVPKRTKLPKGAHFEFQWLGTCSSPLVDGDRVYVVTGAGEVVCLDINGQKDGNDGPYKDEVKYMAPAFASDAALKPDDADIVWIFDTIEELSVCPHDAVSCSILVHGDMLYLSTSNGVDKPHTKMVHPDAPAIVVLNKKTGRLAATDGIDLSRRLYHAQWSSPSSGVVGGRTLIFFGGGDGVCYAFEALEKMPEKPIGLKTVWKYECNPREYKYRNGKVIPYYDGDKRKRRGNKNDGNYIGPSQIIATPVFHDNKIYVATGQDPMHGRGKGMLTCIDATKTGDITKNGKIWSYDGLDRTMSTVAVSGGLLYCADVAGRVHCLEAETGKRVWVYETKAETWSSTLVADDKIYIGTKKHFWILAAGRTPRALDHFRLGSPIYSSAVAANGVLYVTSQKYLWAVAKAKG